jgi:hypothetical protein
MSKSVPMALSAVRRGLYPRRLPTTRERGVFLPGRCCSERFECVSAFAMRTPEPNGRFSEKSAAGGAALSPATASSAIGGRGSRMQDRRLSWTTVLLALIERSATLDRSPQADSRSPLSRRTFASQGARPPECDCSTSTIKTRAVRLATARIEGCEYARAPSDLQSRVLLRCLGNPFPSSSWVLAALLQSFFYIVRLLGPPRSEAPRRGAGGTARRA